MKLSKEELKKKIDEKIEDNDTKIELLEDIEDSFEIEADKGETVSKEEYETLKAEHESLKEKYKNRFLSKDEEKEEKTDDDGEELEEEKVIDVKEIFDEGEK